MKRDTLFTKRLRELTDEAIRESLAEISAELERRFGPAHPIKPVEAVEQGECICPKCGLRHGGNTTLDGDGVRF